MSGGSREPESPTDQQCENCGRYYSAKGIDTHERSCPHPEWAEPLVPLEDGSDTSESVGGDTSEGPPQTQTSPAPEASEGSNPTAETDGGLGLAGPPEPDDDPDEEPSDAEPEPERDTENCPNCGHDLGATEEELRERFGSDPFRCGDCGAELGVDA